jgi:hypothetical protein
MLRQSFISLSMGHLSGKECLKRCLLTHKEMYIKLLKMNRRLPMRLLINSKLTKMYSNLVEPANTMKHFHWKKIGGGDLYGSSTANIHYANFIQFRSYSITYKGYTSTKTCHFNSTSNPVFLCHTRFHCTYYK